MTLVIVNESSYNETNEVMIYNGTEENAFEPYTGGIASPNPDYPQNIKVVTGENIITITDNDNTQSQNYTINLGILELCKLNNSEEYFFYNNSNNK